MPHLNSCLSKTYIYWFPVSVLAAIIYDDTKPSLLIHVLHPLIRPNTYLRSLDTRLGPNDSLRVNRTRKNAPPVPPYSSNSGSFCEELVPTEQWFKHSNTKLHNAPQTSGVSRGGNRPVNGSGRLWVTCIGARSFGDTSSFFPVLYNGGPNSSFSR